MRVSAFIDYFINPKDQGSPENYRKGKFFVISIIIFFIFCALGQVYIMSSGLGGIYTAIANGFLCLLILAFLFIYKYKGFRILLVNILAVFGSTSYFNTYEMTGGIMSTDMVAGIAICCWIFLVANKLSGWIWFGITFCLVFFLFWAAIHGWKDFKADVLAQGYYYSFMNYASACIFIVIIISLHEMSKEKYLKELTTSREDLKTKNKEIEHKNKDITDSINYAKKIQFAVLPHEETIYRSIPLAFILYKPKDIVSGDFFWFHEIDKDNYIIVCADCTGHGIPGALMTVISSSLLNQTVIDNKIYSPSEILMEVDRLLNDTLKQNNERLHNVQDGMDMSLLRVNKATKEMVITSAKRPMVFIRDKKMQDIKGSKFSLGGMRTGEKSFEEIKINYKEDDVLYFFTDGYHDQFGGEKGKKYSSKRLKENLLEIHQKTIPEQKQILDTEIEKWKGDLEQVDDICVIGIRF